ncbi:TIGR01548 family HAD-type hydrolase [Gloeobacter kilaueensis]|uniref:Imidazoleglycerol-phosphate dehydratase n=1 Tax=Gloeobacter kilaueensis (strain ATCC BAA-2537 / CCAP 1431/1 / ULC 316 / JS1) TaxID=1183438 RepID=U5QRS9_GLOK1|nr:TIGR01548 family HAD-type hydrolase [Gloeobacter kilaueensis]AGY60395.1 imidazoleglycerol-phosphate dehydratase [Gloeobacter kilaueensis JS1]
MASKGLVAFDIDGVIRDVSGSYRRAIMDTVEHFGGCRPTMGQIDDLKSEGIWNNDWRCSEELLRRQNVTLPDYEHLVAYFQSRYLGEPPGSGYIASEPLLVEAEHFLALEVAGYAWGFFSGADRYSALQVLEKRLKLVAPPLVAMHEAPEKPDPTGLLQLCDALGPFDRIWYLGDTVADMQTVQRATSIRPGVTFIAIGILPPHVRPTAKAAHYVQQLRAAGALNVWEHFPPAARLIARLEER